ncbi:MAG: flagellar basal body rod protein FlgB [Phycisphaerae bacterium]
MALFDLFNGGATPALISTLTFNEARLAVISENIANATTPGYRAKQLDPYAFQASLRKALDERRGPGDAWVVEGPQAKTMPSGHLDVTPSLKPVDNALFHDGTNISLEREMADLAETAMTHELASELLSGNFDRLRKAIRGTA